MRRCLLLTGDRAQADGKGRMRMHLRSVSSPTTMEKARSIMEDPRLKSQKRRVEERGIILIMRLQKV